MSASEITLLARTAQASWIRHSLRDRLSILRLARHALASQAREIAEHATSPKHRQVSEAIASEVLPVLDALKFLERSAERILAPKKLGKAGLPKWLGKVRTEIRHEPLGIVLVVAPGNYPFMLPAIQVMQALAAGNAVIIKPAPGFSHSAHEICHLLESAGLPNHMVSVVGEDPKIVAELLQAGIQKVLITGSSQTGRAVLEAAAKTLTPVTAELSGADAMVVLDNADLDDVLASLRFGLGLNGAQTCISPRRVVGTHQVIDRLQARIADGALRPSASIAASEPPKSIIPLLKSAQTEGAELIWPTSGLSDAQGYGGPFVLAKVKPTFAVVQQDIPAPVLSLIGVDTTDDIIDAVNECPFKLGASIFGHGEVAGHIANGLDVGVVCMNDVIAPTADPRAPFGGRGASGFGVTRGTEGLLELTRTKVITQRGPGKKRHLDSPAPEDAPLLASLALMLHGGSAKKKWQAIKGLVNAGRAKAEADKARNQTTKDSSQEQGTNAS